ncbi:OST-HTH/LOTUS domain-containing protein [Ralstonia sp. UBA689]|uniref:OST-HTH/LOTUS domain-containing protein n=1 Tax=Ralstonia sp. UBA689 TaxID=1947373 RepID=UPI0025DF445C|nr:OST-HTH/LOTUS domain-containing protein [Ralstonia sp. UBA689]
MVPPPQVALITHGSRSASIPPDDVADLQHEVQRLFGRCLLRLQQYETLIKHLVATHRLAGPPSALERIRAQRIKNYATKPLGYQIDVLLNSFFTTEPAPHASIDDAARSIESPAFGYRSTIQMSAEDYARTKAELKRLVDSRNDLVHDFGGRFDFQTRDGCGAASAYLDDCYSRIDAQYRRLCVWVRGVDAARAMAEAFMPAPGFPEVFQDDTVPDGTTPWATAGIVATLRDAIAELNAGECAWTRLDHAVALIQRKHPGQTPRKYGCKSWRHVLNVCRVFDLEYRAGQNARRVAWFRERDR